MLQAGDPLPNWHPDEPEHDGVRLREERPGERQNERLAAFDAAVGEIAARVLPAYLEADGWLERTRAGLLALLRALDERPETARVLVLDSIAWGPEVLERRGDVLEALAEALDDRARREAEWPRREAERARSEAEWSRSDAERPRGEVEPARREPEWSRREVEPLGPLPETTAENLVGASLSWIHTRLQAESGAPLVELAPSLMSMIAHAYLGAEAAQRELERPLTDLGAALATREGKGQTPSQTRGRGHGFRGCVRLPLDKLVKICFYWGRAIVSSQGAGGLRGRRRVRSRFGGEQQGMSSVANTGLTVGAVLDAGPRAARS